MKKLAVVAIGGNSLIKDNDHSSIEDQYRAVCETAAHIAKLIEGGYNVVVSHGNGPQVGYMLRRSEIANEIEDIHPVPLVNCNADSQGAIGYQIQQALDNEFRRKKMFQTVSIASFSGEFLKTAVTVVTQIAVDRNDPAFKAPSKPIGAFYSDEEIAVVKKKYPFWDTISDAGRGHRRVVPSPKPLMILEEEPIKVLLAAGFCVVAGGGGGIPVIKIDNQWVGVDAVIDKDFATSLMANQLKADLLLISTGVEKVCINFGKANQQVLDKLTVAEANQYIEEGHFAPGSMLPKINAAIDFLKNGGSEAIITNPENLFKAAQGKAGTNIVK